MAANEIKQNASRAELEVRNLHVFYGRAHVIQGIDLNLDSGGALSVVGRNGMGKTTLCNAIMGLLPIRGGSIQLDGEQICGQPPHIIAKLGAGYVPQGRRLWPSLSVNEHLKLASRRDNGIWSIDSIYQTFPRLADRREHSSAKLSGGEQQMLAIARALLGNPRLLIMDEPTEGLAPSIVLQMEDIIAALVADGKMSLLMIEQNIGIATSLSNLTAIMVNGRISRVMQSSELAADEQLQQHLLGIGA